MDLILMCVCFYIFRVGGGAFVHIVMHIEP